MRGGQRKRNYSDERFCYLVCEKINDSRDDEDTCEVSFSRILSAPLKRKGHVIMDLCNRENGNERVVRETTVFGGEAHLMVLLGRL